LDCWYVGVADHERHAPTTGCPPRPLGDGCPLRPLGEREREGGREGGSEREREFEDVGDVKEKSDRPHTNIDTDNTHHTNIDNTHHTNIDTDNTHHTNIDNTHHTNIDTDNTHHTNIDNTHHTNIRHHTPHKPMQKDSRVINHQITHPHGGGGIGLIWFQMILYILRADLPATRGEGGRWLGEKVFCLGETRL
jgi:hypothetical protein